MIRRTTAHDPGFDTAPWLVRAGRNLLRTELQPLEDVALLRRPWFRRSRRAWRWLLPALESRPVEEITALTMRLLLRAHDRRLQASLRARPQLAHVFARTSPRLRAQVAHRIVYQRSLRFLRRCNRYLVDRACGAEFVPLGFVSVSIGGPCNLHCDACLLEDRRSTAPVPVHRIDRILQLCAAANVSIVSLAGPGEPFLDRGWARDLLRCIARNRQLDVVLFTNGSRLDDDLAARIAAVPNLLVLVSVDGLSATHDRRRGAGSFAAAHGAMRRLSAERALFGFAPTVHAGNWEELTGGEFVDEMAAAGCLLGVYNEIVFFEAPRGELRPLGPAERGPYRERLRQVAVGAPVFVLEVRSFDEQRYGCRAKKGTSIHIDAPTGRVSPCVLFPFSSPECSIDRSNSREVLIDIVRHPFFKAYRSSAAVRQHCTRSVAGEYAALLDNRFLGESDRCAVAARFAAATGAPVGRDADTLGSASADVSVELGAGLRPVLRRGCPCPDPTIER